MKGDCPSRSASGCRNMNCPFGCNPVAVPPLIVVTLAVAHGACDVDVLKSASHFCCRAADYGHPEDRKLSGDVMDLLNRIFVVDPEQRITLAGIQVCNSDTL